MYIFLHIILLIAIYLNLSHGLHPSSPDLTFLYRPPLHLSILYVLRESHKSELVGVSKNIVKSNIHRTNKLADRKCFVCKQAVQCSLVNLEIAGGDHGDVMYIEWMLAEHKNAVSRVRCSEQQMRVRESRDGKDSFSVIKQVVDG